MEETADRSSKPKLLLVEDEEHLARLLRLNLEREGYQLRVTASGRRALDFQAAERFDLIILDLMIEEVDGFEVARQVRQRDPRLPILILTARSTEEDRVRGLGLGADDYMTKPFHLSEFLLRVRRMLERGSWYDDRNRRARSIRVGEYAMDMESLRGDGPRGEIQLTPLQLANVASIIANKGYFFTPHLVRAIGLKNTLNPRFRDKHITTIQPQYFIPVPSIPTLFTPATKH